MRGKFRIDNKVFLRCIMRSCKVPIYLILFMLFFSGAAQSQLIIDSVNYAIDLGDAMAAPGDTVGIPVQIKSATALGGFLIRFKYNSSVILPLPLDGCPSDTCAGWCCDSTGIDPDATVYDSIDMVGKGMGTVYIDSTGLFCAPITDRIDTVHNVFALHDPGDDSMHVDAIFLQFLPPIPPMDECKLQYWTRPFVAKQLDTVATIALAYFTVKEGVSMGTTFLMRVGDYSPMYSTDPVSDYRDNQLSDTSGTLVVRPQGALGYGRFTVGEGSGEFDADTCRDVPGATCVGSQGQDTCCLPSDNNPPVVQTISPSSYTIDQGQTVTFSVTATDADDEELSLEASGLPVGATFTPTNPVTGTSSVTGTFTWTPSFTQSGTFGINFQATDERDARSAIRSVVITVNELNIDRLFTTSTSDASPVGGIPGATPVIFPIDLITSRSVYGLQFDMIYPNEVVEIDSIVVTELIPEYVVWENLGDYPDSVRVVTYGLSNEPIQDELGSTVLNVYMTVDSNATPDDYWVYLKDAWESVSPDPSVPSLSLLADSGIVQVDRLGDVNLDKRIDVADLVNVVAYIIGNYGLAKRNFETANVVQDTLVNVVDMIGIINLIYGLPVESSPMTTSGSSGGSVARLGIEYDDLIGGQFTKLNIRGEFPEDVAGVQLQVDYDPGTFELEQPELSEESGSFTLAYNDDESGRMKILLYNYKPWNADNLIHAGEADVLRLPAKIKCNVAAGDDSKIRITKAYLASSTAGIIPTEEPQALLPTSFNLYQNYPNPFNPSTIIEFDIGQGEITSGLKHVTLDVFNILGRKVKTLLDDNVAPGRHSVTWNGTDRHGDEVATGIYLYRLEIDNQYQTKKMLLLK